MKAINLKLFFTVFAVVWMVSCLLGVLRWQWEFGPSHRLNDEITGILFWGLSVFLQAAVYYYALLTFGLYKRKNRATYF
jgi:hypothetical protein